MEWIDGKAIPQKEGWYITLYQFEDGSIVPIPLYYHFAWNIPSGIYGDIVYYTTIENSPVELKDGRFF